MRRIWIITALIVLAAACGGDDTSTEAGSPDDTGSSVPTDSGGDAAEEATNPYEGYVSEVYADEAFWHCRPGMAGDVCASDQDATEVHADGSLEVVPHVPAAEPAFDCFYIYPTVSLNDAVGNQTFDLPLNPLEPLTVRSQAARFTEQCRVFAPRYEQAHIGSYEAAEGDIYETEPFQIAYDGVLDAFRHYMANDNDGRGLVLIGHSQGTHHLTRLVQQEFDDDPVLQEQLISALLIGPVTRITVPTGAAVGDTFETIPLCASATETGCVVAFDSFAAAFPPTALTQPEGLAVACVNPADLIGERAHLAGGYFGPTVEGVGTVNELIRDYYTAECVVNDNGQPYLEIDADPAADDVRSLSHIEDVPNMERSLHLSDMAFSLGDLLALVASQSDAYLAAQ